MTRLLDNTTPTTNREQVYESSTVDTIRVAVVVVPQTTLIAEAHLSASEIRLKQLRRNRTLFGLLSILAFITTWAFGISGLAWEPPASLFFALIGIAVVFAMKIRDAKR